MSLREMSPPDYDANLVPAPSLTREFEAIPGYHLKPSKQSQINRFFAIKALQIAIELRVDRTFL